MELRVLEYFLAVAREQSITAAAEFLHLTQPTLSRQLKDLEDELGKQLLIRGNRKVTLTEDGVFFRKRAEEIVSLARRTEEEMKNDDQAVSGNIYVGAGESGSMEHVMRVISALRREHPGIHVHFVSGDSADLLERLDRGLFDFCLLFGPFDQAKYEYQILPYSNAWGVLMRREDGLAEKTEIHAADLWDKPLILSRQAIRSSDFLRWFQRTPSELDIVATYNLAFNASIMAKEGMGYALTLAGLINTEGTDLCFRPLAAMPALGMSLVWKKYRVLTKASEKFIAAMREYLAE